VNDGGSGSAEAIAAELDAAHERARQAYARRDADAYLATLHPDLAYTQADGRVIGRDQLARDVRAQLARVRSATPTVQREALDMDGENTATELLEQRATFAVRAFGLLNREWTVRRRARYGWTRSAEGWRLRRVEVLSETVSPARTWLGRG
jgi:ketosteroid isomerase-like protein